MEGAHAYHTRMRVSGLKETQTYMQKGQYLLADLV